MSGRHVAHEEPSSTQHMGELCAGYAARRDGCTVHDLGGAGRHRADESGAELAPALLTGADR